MVILVATLHLTVGCPACFFSSGGPRRRRAASVVWRSFPCCPVLAPRLCNPIAPTACTEDSVHHALSAKHVVDEHLVPYDAKNRWATEIGLQVQVTIVWGILKAFPSAFPFLASVSRTPWLELPLGRALSVADLQQRHQSFAQQFVALLNCCPWQLICLEIIC